MTTKRPAKKPAKPRQRRKPVSERDTFALFDLLFKKLIRLSGKAVVAFINGLFGTSYPPTAAVEYLNTETVSSALKRRISDIFIRIDGVTYHIEIQSTIDNFIIIRIFEAGFGHGLDEKTFVDGNRTIRFPTPCVIQIQGKMDTPQTLRLIFPDGFEYDYKVDVLNLQERGIAELGEKGLALLLPFYVLKLRDQVEAAKTSAERASLAGSMSGLLEELLREIIACEKRGVIERQDTRTLIDRLRQLYANIYGQYKELAEEAEMAKFIYKSLEEEVRKETILEVSLETAKRLLADGMPPEKTAKYTRLPVSKVRALAVQPVPRRRSARAAVKA